MDFGEILSKAWKIIWKHKILWLFGVLAGCGMGSAGGGGSSGGNAVYSGGESGSWNGPPFMSPSAQRAFEDFAQWLADIPVGVWVSLGITIVLALILIGLVMSVVMLFAGSFGTAGVIKGTVIADEAASDTKPISLKQVFTGIKPYFWKVLLLNLGLRVAGFIVGFLLFIPIILLVVFTCGLGVFLLIAIGIFIDLMVNFSTIAIIHEDKDIFEAISRAWQVITRDLGKVLVMFLILGLGQIVIGLVIALPLILVPMPLVLGLLALGGGAVGVGVIVSIILFLLIIPIMIFLGGVLKAYVLASWTLTYRRLTENADLTPTVLNPQEPV